MKLEVILWEEIDWENWEEAIDYKQVKQFVLLAFSDEIERSSLTAMGVLAHRAVRSIIKYKTSGEVTCKVHHLLHYHQLIEMFGPLTLYNTMHYERHHQVTKRIVRSTMNFQHLIITICKRHQYRKALFEKKSNFSFKNFLVLKTHQELLCIIIHQRVTNHSLRKKDRSN